MKKALVLSYMGSAYHGWQRQKNVSTIQQTVEEAIERLTGQSVYVSGCGRTDAGVHARYYVASVAVDTTIPDLRLPAALNAHLPEDISVLAAVSVDEEFHPRYGVISKEYEYLILNAPTRDPFLRDRVWHVPQPISDEAVAHMNEAAAAFVGEKDFTALRDGMADEDESNVRRVYAASVTRKGDLISFRVRADGFLYHMVRVMTGTLMEVARGRIPADEVGARIASLDRRLLGSTAPAAGLYLDRVFYEKELF
jgi:tRNA pseudouridine38-40 synthase